MVFVMHCYANDRQMIPSSILTHYSCMTMAEVMSGHLLVKKLTCNTKDHVHIQSN